MEKKKKKRKSIFRILSMILVCLFCAFALTGCVGGGGGGGNSSGGGNQSGGNNPGSSGDNKPSNSLGEIEVPKTPTSDDFLLGAIGVYDIDADKKVFYDKYSEEFMSFNDLITRQFTSLASIICGTLNNVYGGGGSSLISFEFGKKNISYNLSEILSGVEYTYNANDYICMSNVMGGCFLDCLWNDVDADGIGNLEYDLDDNYTVIHAHPNTGYGWTQPNLTIEDLTTKLEELYKSCYEITDDITVIGFTEKFKTVVQEYIIKNVIGSAYDRSINSTTIVKNNSNPTTWELYSNIELRNAFQNYKNYENVIPKLIDSAFKASVNGINLNAWDVDVAGISLYPKLTRTQYIFYDNIEDLQDIKPEEEDFDVNDIKPSQNSGGLSDVNADKGELVDGVYLRQLKNIILIPKLSDAFKNEFKESSFKLDSLFIDFKTEEGETILDFTWSGFARGNAISETTVKFEDGSYEIKFGDQIIKGEKPKDSPITDDGKLTVDNRFYESDMNSMSFTEEDLLKYEFVDAVVSSDGLSAGLSLEEIINASFTLGKEGEQGNVLASKESPHKFLNVYNRLFKVEINKDDNTITTTILLDDNLIKMTFNYNNGDSIPQTYLMKFSIYRKGNSDNSDSFF